MKDRPKKPVLAIVVPCFNEQDVLPDTIIVLLAVLNAQTSIEAISNESFICIVDDGSNDNTWTVISDLCEKNINCQGIKLSRNFGHQNALIAGLTAVVENCDCAITIDADLQQDVAAIPKFIESYKKGGDLVLGVRTDRSSDTLFKKYTAILFYWLMNELGLKLIRNHADYRLISRKALVALLQYREVNIFLRGILLDLGFEVRFVHFDVSERKAGISKYTIRKMLSFALNGLTSFTVVPLRFVTILGTCVFIVSISMGLYIVYYSIFVGGTVPGWSSTVLPIYVLGGLQLMGIGLVGEYIGKIYQEVKSRPRFIIESTTINNVNNNL